MPLNRFIPRDKAAELLHTIRSYPITTAYDQEKHRLTLLDKSGQEQAYFRLPISLPYTGTGFPDEEVPVHYVILLIQSGSCAIGYFENGVCLDHKVFRSYMVRKKQGKSQIKYLKTKGKSRAGSRVRLGETVEFFENINERLQEYFEEHDVHRIAISCSKTLIPYLYGSKVSTPFDKNDPRLFRIPKHIHTPIYEVLLDTHRFLQRGELIYEEKSQEMVDQLLAASGIAELNNEFNEDELEKFDQDDYYTDSFEEDI